MKDQGGSAFPLHTGSGQRVENQAGMSLRDYFAAKATNDDIAGYLVGPVCEQVIDDGNGRKSVVQKPILRSREEAKYLYANAMLKAREA